MSFCIAISNAQEPKESVNHEATENPKVNSGFFLPEAMITEEVQVSTIADDEIADRADEYQQLDLRLYAIRLEKEIARNETEIFSIKERLKQERGKEAIKRWHEITTLDIQNDELKKNLWNYLHYGKGSWILFQLDFNEDLQPLKQDLSRMEQEVQ